MARPQPDLGAPASGTAPEAISTVDGVIQLVRNWIDTAKLKPGDRLPTERALAEQFQLNRNLVRRAFLQLDRMGLINRHVGRGTFVGAPNRPEPMRGASQPTDYSPAAVLQARLMIEPRIAALAVANATQGDLRALEALLEEAAGAAARHRLEAINVAFYRVLATATHNDLIVSIADALAAARDAVASDAGDPLTVEPAERTAAIEAFRAVLDAMRARDPAAAAQSVRRALIRSARAFSMLARMELLPEDE
ncbi:MAG TPA: FCD domain-containing protein [Candidatus Sulfotelmatobacter sp.]|nr:FCD domain-containing protein [Candidatus Sulfotelmatobacter sp.]